MNGALANLTLLSLGENKIGNIGLEALAKAITPDKDGKGGLANLIELNLYGNQIGDAGLSALASACANGALPALKTLFIDSPSTELTAYCSSKSIKLNRF